MTREEALAKLTASRQALHQAIQGLSDQEMTQVQVEGEWTVKDVIGHVSAWEETLLGPLGRYADGESFEVQVIEDYLAWNDEQAARKRNVPLSEILDESAAVRQELVSAASRLSDEQWEQPELFPWGERGTLIQALSGLAAHEMEHVGAIRRWRDS